MSFTETPNTLHTDLISASGIGSLHATRLIADGLPLKLVVESAGNKASAASSVVTSAATFAASAMRSGCDNTS